VTPQKTDIQLIICDLKIVAHDDLTGVYEFTHLGCISSRHGFCVGENTFVFSDNVTGASAGQVV
jgi:hypothetical protein